MADKAGLSGRVVTTLFDNFDRVFLFEEHEILQVDQMGTEEVRKFLALNRTGRGHVVIGGELGDSVQIPNGHWLTGRVTTEFKIPCQVSLESYQGAAAVGGLFTDEIMESRFAMLTARIQAKIDEVSG